MTLQYKDKLSFVPPLNKSIDWYIKSIQNEKQKISRNHEVYLMIPSTSILIKFTK